MTDAPEWIWASEPDIFDGMGFWQDQPAPEGDTTQYIRADVADALVAAAHETAAMIADRSAIPIAGTPYSAGGHPIASKIRAEGAKK